jgi:hypothetical protein
MTAELGTFWDEDEIVPVVGPGAVTGNNRDRNCLCRSRRFS